MTLLPLTFRGHGGACCGCFHLYSFPHGLTFGAYDADRIYRSHTVTLDVVIASIRKKMRELGSNNKRNTEVTLTERQCTFGDGVLTKALAACGFRVVGRFRNSNSGNVVFIFHHTPKPLPLDNLPFEFVARDVTTFRRVSGRTGRATASEYLTLEDAQAGRLGPTINAIDRYVNGDRVETVWTREGAFNPFG